MNKYWHVILVGLQNQLVYRANFFFRASFSLVPLMATLFLWRTIYAGKAEGSDVAGYQLAEMMSYYLVVMIVDGLTAVNDDDWQIASDIRDGRISQFLLKPVDYLKYRLCLYLSGRVVYIAVALVPLGLFGFFMRKHFLLPEDPGTVLVFAISIVMTALIQFFLSYSLALLAFWILEVSTIIFIVFALEYISSGHLFPLDILPASVLSILYCTPFPYMMFFPVSVYLGKESGDDLVFGLSIQLAWVVLTYLLARLMWMRGIRYYSAVGG